MPTDQYDIEDEQRLAEAHRAYEDLVRRTPCLCSNPDELVTVQLDAGLTQDMCGWCYSLPEREAYIHAFLTGKAVALS